MRQTLSVEMWRLIIFLCTDMPSSSREGGDSILTGSSSFRYQSWGVAWKDLMGIFADWEAETAAQTIWFWRVEIAGSKSLIDAATVKSKVGALGWWWRRTSVWSDQFDVVQCEVAWDVLIFLLKCIMLTSARILLIYFLSSQSHSAVWLPLLCHLSHFNYFPCAYTILAD